jgi:aryl-alcohol dehydrogenase-like predicted oxidoreductase
MEYRRLGNSGLEVSVLGLGTNNFGPYCDQDQSTAVVRKALDLGINFFDSADVYGRQGIPGTVGPGAGRSEEYLGTALRGLRREVIIATKFSRPMAEGPLWQGMSRRYIHYAVEDSLRRLGTDYIDLYYIHLPDAGTPFEETQGALDDLVRRGLVRYLGASGFTPSQIAEAHFTAKAGGLTPFITAQNRYNLLEQGIGKALVPVCERYGMGFIPFFPLASGFLTGKYRADTPPEGTRLSGPMGANVRAWMTDQNYAILDRLASFATARGHTLVDLAIGWLTSHRSVSSVIAGATKPEQLEANAKAAEWRLSPEEMSEIADITSR